MAESSNQTKKLQWKWVWITFALYILFYIFPIFIAGNYFTNKITVQIIGAWIFGGIIIVAASPDTLPKALLYGNLLLQAPGWSSFFSLG